MFVVEFYRGYGWYMGADPITTHYQTQNRELAIRFPSYGAALQAVSQYFNHYHNEPYNKYRWGIVPA